MEMEALSEGELEGRPVYCYCQHVSIKYALVEVEPVEHCTAKSGCVRELTVIRRPSARQVISSNIRIKHLCTILDEPIDQMPSMWSWVLDSISLEYAHEGETWLWGTAY